MASGNTAPIAQTREPAVLCALPLFGRASADLTFTDGTQVRALRLAMPVRSFCRVDGGVVDLELGRAA